MPDCASEICQAFADFCIGLNESGNYIYKKNPRLIIIWASGLSVNGGNGGYTQNAISQIESRGIIHDPNVRPVPPGSVKGMTSNQLGALGEAAEAQRLRDQGFNVQQHIRRPGFSSSGYLELLSREVDRGFFEPGPLGGTFTETEIKHRMAPISIGPKNLRLLQQLDNDAFQLRENGRLRGLAGNLKYGGKALGVAGVVVDGLDVTSNYIEEGKVGPKTQKSAAKAGGGMVGGWAGAQAGASIGAWGGPYGAIAGGIIGGIAGAWAGGKAGENTMDAINGEEK